MRILKGIVAAGLFAALTASAAMAQDQAASFNAQNANIHSGPGGQPLTLPSQASAPSVVANFLSGEGLSDGTVGSLVLQSESSAARTGLTHLRFEQQVGGLTVFGAYVKATVNGDGQLTHLIEALATPGNVRPAVIDSRDALDAAMAESHPGVNVTLGAASGSGNTVSFSGDDFFYRNPTVTSVAIAMNDGALQAGFLVETWSGEDNLLNHTLVGSNGRVLGVQLRTNNDSYNTFADQPDTTSQAIVSGPGAGNTESPSGWLSVGDQTTVNISGNNAHAYLDTDANNNPDAGGSLVGDGNFLTSANLSEQPDTMDNQEVAVQNLFYWNNVIHDKLYSHGFDEDAGNFQTNNFGNGGNGGDAVLAEAQDGSGTDNANFSTPNDGSPGRMQMFLWNGAGDYLVEFGPEANDFYIAAGAAFGPGLGSPLNGNVVAATDPDGTTTDGCTALTNVGAIAGNIALIDRGNCDFVDKVNNAEDAGASGVIIANNAGDNILTMGGTDNGIGIPSVFIGQSDGADLRASLLLATVNVTLKENPNGALSRDGDVDSDIIWHEYGHGLTWRMIGNMSGAMSGAIGEGMSDVLAILSNDDDTVGEYSTNDPLGIRSESYTGYSRTYGDFDGGSVHFDGEIYAAIGWRLGELFDAAFVSRDILFDYLIDGMNYTPSGPAFEDMRDGILQAATDPAHECLIWQAFAQYGVGEGASSSVKNRGPFNSSVTVSESDVVPGDVCVVVTPATDAAIASVTVLIDPILVNTANTVRVQVDNNGNTPIGPINISLTDDDSPVGSSMVIALIEAGQTASVDFGWTPTIIGGHALIASHDLVEDDDTSNDSATNNVTVVTALHDVAVQSVSAPASVSESTIVDVAVVVMNEGTFEETFDVTLTDDTAGATIDVREVTLAPGAQTTLHFNWDTTDATHEAHTLTARHDLVTDAVFGNDSASADSTITEPVVGPSVDDISPAEMLASDPPMAADITGIGFGTIAGDVTVTFTNGSGPAPTAIVENVIDGEINVIVSVKANGKKGPVSWDVVVTTPNGSDVWTGGFLVTR